MTMLPEPILHLAPSPSPGIRHVRVGVPLPRGWLDDPHALSAVHTSKDASHSGEMPLQTRVLARWPDRSIKWLLTDLAVQDDAAGTAHTVVLRQSTESLNQAPSSAAMRVTESPIHCEVDTGAAVFAFKQGSDALITGVRLASGVECLSSGVQLRLSGANPGKTATALLTRVDSVSVAEQGPVSTVVLLEGSFKGECPLEFTARCTLVQGSATAVIDLRLRNPRAAMHRGGLWDLGDPASFLISEAAVVMKPACTDVLLERRVTADGPIEHGTDTHWSILQDSSGGQHWDSPNHLEADDQLGVSFQGYAIRSSGQTVSADKGIMTAGRAQPTLAALGKGLALAVSVRDFWQNFPKSLEWARGELRIGLFPSGRRVPVELQGGEQKRHRLALAFGLEESVVNDAERAVDGPHAWVDPAWVEASGAVRGLVANLSQSPGWNEHVRTVVDGPNSFIERRELIDEYGWRNFGDLYADHEAVNHTGPQPFVTHYNNQYDFVWAAGLHAIRTGDARWARLARECAEHTADIDVYHTTEDRAAFSGGLFWHTDHYLPARTATHRTYSVRNAADADAPGGAYGGGPANEHNYASGLLLHYWRTGDEDAREAVIGLADWVIAMDDGAHSMLAVVDAGPTGLSSKTVDAWFHGPGRGAGNSLATLMDGYLIGRDRTYLETCEALIRRCIHPLEDISKRGLNDIEHRWSYLAFLQSLGRYLELKLELGEIDFMFQYARESLLHYAQWMLEHEVPYKDVLHRVELPTESWTAHDIRKCHVFHLAARFDDCGKAEVYAERAAFFHDRCLADLNTFATRHLTRPLVLLSVYGHLHAYYTQLAPVPDAVRRAFRHDHDFGEPTTFVLPRDRMKGVLKSRIRTVRSEVSRLVRDRLILKLPAILRGGS
jgi:hypothetical protein